MSYVNRRAVTKESDIEYVFAAHLEELSLTYEKQCACAAGVMDIAFLTASGRPCIVEIKKDLSRRSIFEAIGQLMVYKLACMADQAAQIALKGNAFTDRRYEEPLLIICGMWHAELNVLKDYLDQLGIRVIEADLGIQIDDVS